jgi:1,4-alpha-glucan branching enzyme
MADTSILMVLDAQLPYYRHPDKPGCVEESLLFNAISGTYLPLLRSCTALETEGVPFKLAISFAPSLCEMLSDPMLQDRYLDWLDRAIDFGLAELERNSLSPEARELIKIHLDQLQLNRRDYVDIYERNILKKFDYFATRGFLEILATTATNCFLPLYADIPEAISAQIETGMVTYRKHFTSVPIGFWLPAMAWSPGIEVVLKSYGFHYTIVDSRGLLFADPVPETGVFAPVTCRNGFTVFGRDKNACMEVSDRKTGLVSGNDYLDVDRDIGFELDEETLSALFDIKLGRRCTGFRYWSRTRGEASSVWYQLDKAHTRVCADAVSFLEKRRATLDIASKALEGAPVTDVCAFPASLFGDTWYEGVAWLENLFRSAVSGPNGLEGTIFALPSTRMQTKLSDKRVVPYYSSWLESGYAEEVLNNSNDWMYPYIRKATERMIDLAERFPDDTGLKERALNMASRELLLAQSMDWFLMMNESDKNEYARMRFEESVKAFTVVYESLGSNFISTEWLTTTEKLHNLFTGINYRVFSRKK